MIYWLIKEQACLKTLTEQLLNDTLVETLAKIGCTPPTSPLMEYDTLNDRGLEFTGCEKGEKQLCHIVLLIVYCVLYNG